MEDPQQERRWGSDRPFFKATCGLAKALLLVALAVYVLGTWRYARHKFLGVPNPGNPIFYFDEERERVFDSIIEYTTSTEIEGHHLRNLKDPYLRKLLKDNGLNYWSNTGPWGAKTASDLFMLARFEARQWDVYILAETRELIDEANIHYEAVVPLQNKWYYLYR